jgi:hypothetical protein
MYQDKQPVTDSITHHKEKSTVQLHSYTEFCLADFLTHQIAVIRILTSTISHLNFIITAGLQA